MKIKVVPYNDSRAADIKAAINKVVQQHPLVTENLSCVTKQLHGLTIQITIMTNFHPISMPKKIINNKLDLSFDPCRYSGPEEIENVLYHEFTHLVDRLDPNFGLDDKKGNKASKIQPPEITNAKFSLYEHIWNCNIDGRLSAFGKNPRTLEERVRELCVCLKSQGHFDPSIDAVLQRAWHGKGFNFDDIIELTRRCLDYWQP